MSTKLYDGYVIPAMTLLELKEFVVKLQKKCKAKQRELFNNVFSSLVGDILDAKCLGVPVRKLGLLGKALPKNKKDKKYEKDAIYTLVFMEWIERLQAMEKDKHLRDWMFDLSFKIVFFPMKDKILAYTYGENPALIDIWENTEGVKDYHYQNQCDKPDKIPSKEWTQRRKDWDKVLLDANGVPSQDGFCVDITLNSTGAWPEKEEILAKLNARPFDDRVRHLAKSKVIQYLMKKYRKEHPEPTKGDWVYWSRMYRECVEWTENNKEEFEKMMAKYSKSIVPKLYKEITEQLIFTSYKDIVSADKALVGELADPAGSNPVSQ